MDTWSGQREGKTQIEKGTEEADSDEKEGARINNVKQLRRLAQTIFEWTGT